MNKKMVGKNWKWIYGTLFVSEMISLLGSYLVHFAIIWYLTDKTGSAGILAGGSLAVLLPGALLGPFTGSIIDRFNRKLILIISDIVIACGTILLVVLFSTNNIEIWHIIVVIVISSVFGSVQFASMQTVISSLVPERHLQRVQGLNNMLKSAIVIAGPALGAFLMGFLDIHWVLSIDVITAGIAVLVLLFLPLPSGNRESSEKVTFQSLWMDTMEGFRFLINWKGLFYIVIGGMILSFVYEPVLLFLPLLIKNHFGMGVTELGIIESGWGIGALIGGLLISVWGGFKKKIHTMLLGTLLESFSFLFIGFAEPSMFWLAFTGVLIFGFSENLGSAPLMAILQSKVPEELRGRLISILTSLLAILPSISLAIIAPVAEYLGVRTLYYLAAVITFIVFLVFIANKEVTKIDTDTPFLKKKLPENASIPNLGSIQKSDSAANSHSR